MARSDSRVGARCSDRSRRQRGRLTLAAALTLALPFGLACNSIIGLSDFDKGQCAGARCPDEGGLFDQLVGDGGVDAPADARPDVKGADPVSWAKWPMPNYGEGGAGLPPPNGSLTGGNGVVTDNTTKLVWRSTLLSGPMKAADADAECRKLSGGPWRAPKRIELVTLLDYSRLTPFVDTSKFQDLAGDTLWSTSEVRPFDPSNPSQAYWAVNFGSGEVAPRPGDAIARVLCVLAK